MGCPKPSFDSTCIIYIVYLRSLENIGCCASTHTNLSTRFKHVPASAVGSVKFRHLVHEVSTGRASEIPVSHQHANHCISPCIFSPKPDRFCREQRPNRSLFLALPFEDVNPKNTFKPRSTLSILGHNRMCCSGSAQAGSHTAQSRPVVRARHDVDEDLGRTKGCTGGTLSSSWFFVLEV